MREAVELSDADIIVFIDGKGWQHCDCVEYKIPK